MIETVIRTSALSRRFGDVLALDRLELEVPRCAVYGFLGPNGAGKTTAIRLLLGLIRATAGEVALFGVRLEPRSRVALLHRVGALVESPTPYPHLTGRENLQVAARLRVLQAGRVDAVLAAVRLERDANRPVRAYSLGMRQRLGLAQALLASPELLALDEPTNGLDPAGIQEVRETLRRLPGETGATVFLSSHLLSEVEQIATDIGVLRQGRLLFQGPIQALQAERQPRVLVRVAAPAGALRALRAGGWSAARVAGQRDAIMVEATSPDDAARINSMLVLQGLAVNGLETARSSLEEIFLRLTRAVPSPAVPAAGPEGGTTRDPGPAGRGGDAAGRDANAAGLR
jgi:lantibiotic transport system ATP-binding protein